MAFVDTHPQYRETFATLGLASAGDFLALPGVVCCGHPDRHVMRVSLGKGADAIPAFLKREHCVRWRDRLANAWAGFGLCSRSYREFTLLRMVEPRIVGGPEALAAGEDDQGRAFLLVRELEGYQDLRQFLREMETASPTKRRDVARQLGAALARMHNAGLEHGDLYSKHVLIAPAPPPEYLAFRFLDWQRGQRRMRVGWTSRWRDLATLDATLAEELATPRERLLALHTYLRASRTREERACGLTLATAAAEVSRRSRHLLERRRIREMRQPPLPVGRQNLVWLDGEQLLVTREFQAEMGELLKKGTACFSAPVPRPAPHVTEVTLPGARLAHLVTRWASRPWLWLWSCLRRRPLVAPELDAMKVLFRLQRYGVVMPRLLAAGQKHVKPWQMHSFLLTEPLQGAVPLPRFLAHARAAERRTAVRRAAEALRQMHQANCYFQTTNAADLLAVCPGAGVPTVALASVHQIAGLHHANPVRARRDLAAVAGAILHTCSRADLLRGLLVYVGQRRLTPPTRQFARRLLRQLHAPRRVAA
jgi:tRNA A-37 threonylcarbamoyl transferase component Bud32